MKEIGRLLLFLIILVGIIVGSSVVANILFTSVQAQNFLAAGFAVSFVICLYFFYQKYFYNIQVPQTELVQSFDSSARWISFGFLLGTVMVWTTFLVALATQSIAVHFSPYPSEDYYLFLFFAAYSALCSAIWEEVAFRGFLLNRLEKITSIHVASFIIAALFGVLHLLSPVKSVEVVLCTFLAGLFLNYSFLRTKNLLFVIAIHFSWNFFTSILYSKKYMNLENLSPLAGKSSPEEGLIAITVTLLGTLFAIFILPKVQTRFFKSRASD